MTDMRSVDLDAYLERIGVAGPLRADADTLDALHVAQVGAIPFEALDVVADPPRPVRIDPAGIAAKLVAGRRGGYCFEQNGLLRAVLTALGLPCRPVMARVSWKTGVPGGRTHMLLLVEAGGRPWLADTGFGRHGLISPLPLEPGVETVRHGESWRLLPVTARDLELQVRLGGVWAPLYRFDPDEPALDADIAIANHYMSSHPDSRFMHSRVVARATPGCRRSLHDGELKIARDGVTSVRAVTDGEEYRRILAEEFQLVLPEEMRLKPWPAEPA